MLRTDVICLPALKVKNVREKGLKGKECLNRSLTGQYAQGDSNRRIKDEESEKTQKIK